MKVALTIGASDPTSGAGIQMDLKVFHALNIYGLTVITAVTAQSTQEFSSVYPLSGETIMKQFEILIKDIKPHAAKTGMLYSKEAVQCVIDSVKKFNLQNLVIDPVINATLGAKLIEDDAFKLLKEELVPLSTAITANIPEAEFLTSTKIEKSMIFTKLHKKYIKWGQKLLLSKEDILIILFRICFMTVKIFIKQKEKKSLDSFMELDVLSHLPLFLLYVMVISL